MTRTHWSAAEDRYLRRNYRKVPLSKICKFLGRSQGSVKARAGILGLRRKQKVILGRLPTLGMLALAGNFYGVHGAAKLHKVDPAQVEEAMARQ